MLHSKFLDRIDSPVWILDKEFKYVYVNRKYYELYKLQSPNIIGKTIYEVLPEYLTSEYTENINKVISLKKQMKFNKVIDDNYYECKIFIMFNEDDEDEIQYIAGYVVDVSEIIEKQNEVIKQRNILQTVIDTLPDVIFLKGIDGRYEVANTNCSKYYVDLGIKSIIGKKDSEINPDPILVKAFEEDDYNVIKRGVTLHSQPTMKQIDGSYLVRDVTKAPLIGEDGNVKGVVGISRDITENKRLEAKLKYISYTDILTGVYNRSSFEEKIQGYGKAQNMPVAILMGDVNGLKLINDTFGHLEGDKLLRSIANVLKKVCGDYADVFRWGGDEFVIAIPNAEEDICDNVINQIKEECKNYQNKYIELSISMGGAIYKDSNIDIYDTLKVAEEMVYKHKLLEQRSIVSSSVKSLLEMLETKTSETQEHTQRMVSLALELGEHMQLSISDLDELVIAARLHDIGKIGISEELLTKPQRLTDDEFEIMKTHSEKGYRIVMASNGLESVAKAVLAHHERWSGKGYPLGLKGEEIPLLARIISIVDSYDAMTSVRPYQKPKTIEEALNEIERCKGTQFDANIADVFIKMIRAKFVPQNIVK